MGKIINYALKKSIGKKATIYLQERIYNLPDSVKGGVSISLDTLGTLNGILNLFYGAGELSDLATTAPLNSFWIGAAYQDPTMARIGFWEEALPLGITDLIPSNFIAHRRYMKRKEERVTTKEE